MESYFHFRKQSVGWMLVALVSLAQAPAIYGQTYTFGPTGGGYQEFAYSDGDNQNDNSQGNENGNGSGRFPGFSTTLSLNSLGGAIAYNSASGTIQLTENFTVSAFNISGGFQDNHSMNGSRVPAVVSVNSSFANVNNGVISFQTGSLSPIASGGNSWSVPIPISLTGSYSLTTGGGTYTGTFNYTITMDSMLRLNNITTSSADFDWVSQPGFASEQGPIYLAQTTAPNGLPMSLGITDPSDGSTYWGWNVSGITNVPEPRSVAIFIYGLLGIGVLRRSFVKQAPR